MTNNQYDVEEFKIVFNQTIKYLETIRSSDLDWMKHLRVFGKKTIQLTSKLNKPQELAKFTYDELWAAFYEKKFHEEPTKAEDYREKITRFEKSFKDTISANKANYVSHLENAGCKSTLIISGTVGGGAGNKSKRYLSLEPIASKLPDSENEKPLIKEIDYKLVEYPQFSWLARPFKSIELKGWRLGVFALLLAAIFVEIILLLLFIFTLSAFGVVWPNAINFLIYAILFTTTLIYPFRAYYMLNHSRITIAPYWMIPLSLKQKFNEAQLVSVPSDSHKGRKIELRIYKSDCPICGSLVEVVKGKGEFKNRLIGQCFEAGNEHIFSFDHVTKKGVPLRSNGYYRVHNLSKSEETD